MNTTTLNVLNTLVNKLSITEDAFYATTLGEKRLDFQGHMSAETFQIARELGIQLEPHPTHTWFEGNAKFEGINIKICLTIG